MRRRTAAVLGILLVASIAVQTSLTSAVDVAGDNIRLSIAIDGETNGPSGAPLIELSPAPAPLDVSSDGRYVAFHSEADNLVADDTNGAADIFVSELDGPTVLVSISTAGEPGNGPSLQPRISSDGRFVVFQSDATNFDDLDGNNETDVFVHDRDADGNEVFDEPEGTSTVRVSFDNAGEDRPNRSVLASVSDNGRYVSFQSIGDFVEDDTNGVTDVYVHDRDANGNNEFDEPGEIATIRVSVATDGTQAEGASTTPSLSGDGRFVVFASSATNLDPEDSNEATDIFVHDRDADGNEVFDEAEGFSTVRVGLSTGGDEPDAAAVRPVISGNGRFVAFESAATTLFDGDGNGLTDVFLRDRNSDGDETYDEPDGVRTTWVSLSSRGSDLGGTGAGLSDNGQLVSFVTGAEGTDEQIFVWDALLDTTEVVSTNTDGLPGGGASVAAVLSADAGTVAYASHATDLGPTDENEFIDVYARPLQPATEPEASSEPTPTPLPGDVSASVELTVEIDGEGTDDVEAGAAEVAIADIPPEAIPLTLGSIESAPLRNIELTDSPLRNIPLRNIPLRNIGIAGDPLDTILLSSIPLTTAGGWEAVLAGTALQGVPLHSVTLQDVLELNPLPAPLDPAATSVEPLTLEQIDLSASPLRNIGLASITLGAVPLRNIPLEPDDVTEQDALDSWCALLTSLGFSCSAFGIVPSSASDTSTPTDPSTAEDSTLLALDIGGVPLRNIPLRNIPLRNIDLADAPLRNIRLDDLSIDVSPLRNIPLQQLALESAPLRNIPLRNIPLRNISPTEAPLRNILLADIPDCPTLFDQALVNCSTDTLGAAADANAILEAATLGDIVDALDGFALGDLNFYGDLTVGDVYEAFPDDITLAAILIALLDTLDYPWEELPLDEIGVQDFARAGGEFEYELRFALDGDAPPTDAEITFDLPAGFRLISQPEWFLTGGDGDGGVLGIDIGQPTVNGSQVTFSPEALPVGPIMTLVLPVKPGLQLGSFDASVTVTPVGNTSSSTADSVTVTETHEPNDDPASAPTLEEGVLYVSHITSPDDLDFFQIPAPPAGSRITVHLSHLSDDNDLVVYSPAGSELRAADPRFIGLQGTAVEDDGIDFDTSDDVLAPETLQDVPIELPNVASVSATRLTEDELVESVSIGGGEPYVIQVSGYNGATSDQPYVLRVEIDGPIVLPPCTARVLPGTEGSPGTMAALPTDLNTIFLINQDRFGDTHGAAAAQSVVASLNDLASRGDLGVIGAVVSVEATPAVTTAYGAWDANPCDPLAANSVVNAIGQVIDSIREDRPSLDHVVLVGGDDVIPMARVPDLTTLANERDYAATFADGNNQYLGALATEHILSDDPYVDFDPIPFLDRHLFLPDLALGRLVETPEEITAAVDNFIDFKGVLDPQTALTTGYDFLADGATEVSEALSAATGATADLLVTEDWDRDELIDHFLPSDGEAPDIASVNAHYDHNRSLPALGNSTSDEGDLFTTADVDGSGLSLLGRILFTMGCHAGLSVSDVIVGASTANAPDWGQTYAGSSAAAYAANTGYGYGDTAVVAYSERLMTLFAERLNGTMSVGEALTFAKQEYFAGLAMVGVYDEKAMTEAAFYGLPMYTIDTGATPPAPPAPPDTFTDPVTGLEVAELELRPSFDLETGPIGDYYEANLPGTTSNVQVTHYRPVQPRVEVDVTQPDAVAHDALITGLTQQADVALDAAFSRPIVDLTANEPETTFGEAIFPSRLQSMVTYNAPDGQRQRLVVVPGQFFTDSDDDEIGVQRLFSDVDALVMYTDDASTDFVRPIVRQVSATTIGTSVTFEVEAADPEGLGLAAVDPLARVLVLFRHAADPLTWTPLDLVNTPGTNVWTGGAVVADANPDISYFVQAVDASGNVGVSTNKGSYFAAITAPNVPEDVDVTGPTTDGTWFTGDVTVAVDADGFSRSVDGGPSESFTGSFEVTGDGVHHVDIFQNGDSFASFFVPIDTTSPIIVIDTPPDEATYTLNESVAAAYRCVDALSGVGACDGPTPNGSPVDTTTIGMHEFSVSAADIAGNAAAGVTHGYAVNYDFDGFFSPVNNPPTINTVQAGRGVPLKFSLGGDQGLAILAAGYPKSVDISCTTAALSDTVEETLTASTSTLQYDPDTDRYVYVWKTERTWRSTCRKITFRLVDGTEHFALFRFN